MPTTYGLGPTPILQFTLNNGQWNAFGTLVTLDWETRQPKATYSQPGGMSPYPTAIPLDAVGRTSGYVYWESTSSYYLELRDRNGVVIRSAVAPYLPLSGGGGSDVTTFLSQDNLIINGQFRFFPVQGYEPIPTSIANLAEGGWSFFKNGTNSSNSLYFRKYTPDNTAVDASPVYYLNYVATGAGADETENDIIFTIRDVRTLANESITVGVNLRSAIAGTYDVSVIFTQNFGSPSTGITPSSPVDTLVGTFMPTSTATDYPGTITIPALTGKTVGINGDDNVQIKIRMPLNSVANIEIANVYFKRGGAATEYPFISSDQTDSIIKGLSIPDHASSTDFPNDLPLYSAEQAFNALSLLPDDNSILTLDWVPPIPIGAGVFWFTETLPPGPWVGAKGQPLLKSGQYRRLYNVWGVDYGTPADNYELVLNESTASPPSFIMKTTAPTLISPATAGTTTFTIEILAPSYVSGIEFVSFNMAQNTATFENVNNGAFAPVAADGNSGMTITVISNGTVSTAASWSIAALPASSLTPSHYFQYDSDEGAFYIYLIIDGVGADPVIPGRVGRALRLEGTNTDVDVALRLQYAVQGNELDRITPTAIGLISPGNYWEFSIATQNLYNWFKIDNVGTDPAVGGKIGVRTDLASTDTPGDIVNKIIDSLNPLYYLTPDTRGYFMRVWDDGAGIDPDAATRLERPDGVSGDHVGTTQLDEFKSHDHPPLGGNFLASGIDGLGGGNPTISGFGATGLAGGSETRPKNFYYYQIIRY